MMLGGNGLNDATSTAITSPASPGNPSTPATATTEVTANPSPSLGKVRLPPPPVPRKPFGLTANKIRQRARLSVSTFTSLAPSIRSRTSTYSVHAGYSNRLSIAEFAGPSSAAAAAEGSFPEDIPSPSSSESPTAPFPSENSPTSASFPEIQLKNFRPCNTTTPVTSATTAATQQELVAAAASFSTEPNSTSPFQSQRLSGTVSSRRSRRSYLRRLSIVSARPSISEEPGENPSYHETPEEAMAAVGITPEEEEDEVNDEVDIVPVFTATALYDFDGDLDSPETVAVRAGDVVTIYGTNNVRGVTLPESMTEAEIVKEVEVAAGWCQVERMDGILGFAPVAYFQFDAAKNATQDVTDTSTTYSASETPAGPPLEEETSFSAAAAGYIPVVTYQYLNNQYRYQYESIGSLPEPDTLSIMGMNINGASSAEGNGSIISYPSTMSTLTSTTAFLTDKLRTSLKRVLNNWFASNTVQDFINHGASSNTGQLGSNINEDTEANTPRYSQASFAGLSASKGGDKLQIKDGKWVPSTPEFRIIIGRPEKRRKVSADRNSTATLAEDFVSYPITSWFVEESAADDSSIDGYSTITVHRRFRDFDWLHDRLLERLPSPAIILPTLPHKSYARRTEPEYIAKRKRALERYLNQLVRHPVARSEEVLMLFLSCGGEFETGKSGEDYERAVSGTIVMDLKAFVDQAPALTMEDEEWNSGMKQYDEIHNAQRGGGPASVFRRVSNVDDLPEDRGQRIMDRFETHLALIHQHTIPVLDAAKKHQKLLKELRLKYEYMSKGMEALARGTDNDRDVEGRLVAQLSWCWRDQCAECFEFSSSLLRVSKHLHGISEVLDSHVRNDVVPFLDTARGYAEMIQRYHALCELHDVASDKYDEITSQHPTSPTTPHLLSSPTSPTSTAHYQQRPPPPPPPSHQQQPSQHQRKRSASSTLAATELNDMKLKPKSAAEEEEEAIRARLDTIFGVALAEVNHLHESKCVEWKGGMKEWLDGQISAQEKILNHLKAARDSLDGTFGPD